MEHVFALYHTGLFIATAPYYLVIAAWGFAGQGLTLLWTGVAAAFNFMLADLSNEDVPLAALVRRGRFSVCFYLLHSLRSHSRYLRDIRAKYFLVPVGVLAVGLALSRAFVAPLLLLVFLWLLAAGVVFLTENNAVQRELANVRNQRATQQPPSDTSSSQVWVCIIYIPMPFSFSFSLPHIHALSLTLTHIHTHSLCTVSHPHHLITLIFMNCP